MLSNCYFSDSFVSLKQICKSVQAKTLVQAKILVTSSEEFT